jgi:hypothetical protein
MNTADQDEVHFLLRSLADLEREHEAGDVSELDYVELKSRYTARAAASLRSTGAGGAAPSTTWRVRLLAIGACCVLIAGVSWLLLATQAERRPGAQMSGLDPRSQREQTLSEARALLTVDPIRSEALYSDLLTGDPDEPVLLTYHGWALVLSALVAADSADSVEIITTGIDDMSKAIEIDPAYADPYCLLGFTLGQLLGDTVGGQDLVDTCLNLNPPADLQRMVEAMELSSLTPPSSRPDTPEG